MPVVQKVAEFDGRPMPPDTAPKDRPTDADPFVVELKAYAFVTCSIDKGSSGYW
jgi:hypothetical protein